MAFEYPREIGRKDPDALWEDVWRLVEQLRLLEEQINEIAAALQAGNDRTGDMT